MHTARAVLALQQNLLSYPSTPPAVQCRPGLTYTELIQQLAKKAEGPPQDANEVPGHQP